MSGPPRPVTTAREWAARAGILPWYAGGPGEPFTPLDLPGLALWLDASDLDTITESSGAVSQWDDKSGHGRHFAQGTAASQPALVADAHNGRAAIRFDGTNDVLSRTTAEDVFRNAPAATVYVVALTTNHEQRADALWVSIGTVNTTPRLSVGVSALGGALVVYRRLDADGTNTYSSNSVQAFPEDALTLLTVEHDWTARTGVLRFNGADVTSVTLATSAGSTSNTAALAMHVGRGGSTEFWVGDICEVLVYQGAHTDSDRKRVERYLANKWGLTLS